MKFKGEENTVLWESYVGNSKMRNSYNQEDAEDNDFMDDEMDDKMGDEYGDDEMEFDEMGDDFNEPEAQGMVMEIEPVGHVEAHEVNEVLVSELKKLAEYSKRLYDMKNECEFEDWMVSAITIASTYVSDVWHRLDAKADLANTGFEQAEDY